MHHTRTHVPALAGLLLLAPLAQPGDVWKVPSVAPNIRLAVNVAAPGDVILVAPGTYTQVVTVDGKGVSIVADGSATLSTLVVRNVPAGQTFLLDGFTLDLPDLFAGPDIPFHAENNVGALRLQECTFQGDPGIPGNWTAGVSAYGGSAGAIVSNSASVAFHRCTFLGGKGADLNEEDFESHATSGGDGLQVVDSVVVVFDSIVTGGVAGDSLDTVAYNGASGGNGIRASGTSVLHVQGSRLAGGSGGSADCDFWSCGSGGAGGSGIIHVGGATHSFVRHNEYFPGSGGWPGDFQEPKGPDGVDIAAPAGSVTESAVRYRAFAVSTPARENGAASLVFEGDAGDGVLLFAALNAGLTPLPARAGVFLLGVPLVLPGTYVGTVPGGGELTALVTIPELGPGVEGFALHLQPAFADGAGTWLGPVNLLTLLDAAF